MTMPSLADLLAAARQMATAARTNQERLAARGASPEFIQQGEGIITALEAADVEQERLKAQLKAASAQVAQLQKDLDAWQSEASSIVKLAYRGEKEKWIEFGIKAKR
jgi:hypothetical protein